MEEHFNNNYLESDRYPKATLKGIIEKFDLKDLGLISKKYYIKGKITIHGKSKTIRVAAKIKKDNKGVQLISSFSLNTDDFNIEIPFIVRSKISKEVTVTVYSNLQ
jgi:polyisoprenoid-binding protein YceI